MSWNNFLLFCFFSFFARVWERLVLISLLTFSRIHHWTHLVQSFSLLRVLKLLTQPPDIDLFKVSVSSWVSFDSFWPISYLGIYCLIFTYLWIPQISWYWVLILFHCGQRLYFIWCCHLKCSLSGRFKWRLLRSPSCLFQTFFLAYLEFL